MQTKFSFFSQADHTLGGRTAKRHPNLGETPGTSTPLCLLISLNDGHWYAHNCLATLPYICKVPPVSRSMLAPTQCPSGWTYLSSSKKCYKVTKRPENAKSILVGREHVYTSLRRIGVGQIGGGTKTEILCLSVKFKHRYRPRFQVRKQPEFWELREVREVCHLPPDRDHLRVGWTWNHLRAKDPVRLT